MRSFYLCFINRAYATNIRLKAWGYKPRDLCSFCNTMQETCIHLFWECEKIQTLWKNAITFCKRYISESEQYTKATCMLFGFQNPTLNFVMLSIKYTIHLACLFNTPLHFHYVLHQTRQARNVEAYIASRYTQFPRSKFEQLWKPLLEYPFAELI